MKISSGILHPCTNALFELADGSEFVIELAEPLPSGHRKNFITPLHAFGELIGWIEFEYAVMARRKLIYRAIRLHQAGDVDPAAPNICLLLSTPRLKGSPNVS